MNSKMVRIFPHGNLLQSTGIINPKDEISRDG